MPIQTTCPGEDVFKALVMGLLPPSEVEEWSEHLLQCSVCAERAARCNEKDALIEALGQAQTLCGKPDDTLVGQLMAKLARIGGLPASDVEATNLINAEKAREAKAVVEATGRTARDTVESGTATEAEQPADEELSHFLAPAEAPDKIGRLGPYRVLKVLVRSGMGVVFRRRIQG